MLPFFFFLRIDGHTFVSGDENKLKLLIDKPSQVFNVDVMDKPAL